MAHVAVWSLSRTLFLWRDVKCRLAPLKDERQQPLISKLVGIGKVNTTAANLQPVRFVVNDRGLFTAG